MSKRYHTVTITIYNRNATYQQVGELLHQFAADILLRVGYPVTDQNTAVIFLMLHMTNDQLGALSGKLGQLDQVKVKTGTLKL